MRKSKSQALSGGKIANIAGFVAKFSSLVAKIAGLVAKIAGLVELILVIAYDLVCIHKFTLGTEYQGLFWLSDVLSWVVFFYKMNWGGWHQN
jgi:hypothetical protein